jgi:hypothetical protein
LIQSEVRGKAVEAHELSSEEDEDADAEGNVSGAESSRNDGSSSDAGQDDGEEVSSDRETSSPKVDVIS